jgi:hypothetical protein
MDVDIDIDGLVRDMAQTYEDVKEVAWENRETCPNGNEDDSDCERDVEDVAATEVEQDLHGRNEEDRQRRNTKQKH